MNCESSKLYKFAPGVAFFYFSLPPTLPKNCSSTLSASHQERLGTFFTGLCVLAFCQGSHRSPITRGHLSNNDYDMTSSYSSTTTTIVTTTPTDVSRFWQCPDGWPQTGVWCNYYPDGHTASAPSTHLLDDAFKLLKYSLIAFVALRMVTRTSTSALLGLCLIMGGFVYDAVLHLPVAEAAATGVTSIAMAALSTTSALSTSSVSLPMFAKNDGAFYAPFQPPSPGSAPGPNMYPGGPHGAPRSAASRFATPGSWLVCAIVVCFCFARVAGGRQSASSSHSIAVEVSKTPVEDMLASCAATPDLIGPPGERVYMAIPRPMAGRLLAERKEIEPTKEATGRRKSVAINTDQDKTPSATKIVLLLAMLLLAGMIIPMALAEPTGISMSTLPSPFPCSAVLDTTGTAVYPNHTLALQEKDKPESWIYRSSGMQPQANPLWVLATLLLIGNFLLPTLAAFALVRFMKADPLLYEAMETPESSETSTAAMALHATDHLDKRTAQNEVPPAWVTTYTTTTTTLPTMTVTDHLNLETDAAASPISAAGSLWQPVAAGIDGICTESNSAVCPIVLGRKSWEASFSAAVSTRISKVALLAIMAALAVLIAAESGQPVYVPVETTKAIAPAVEPRTAAFDEPTHVLVGTPLRYESTKGGTLRDISIQTEAGELVARNIDAESSICDTSTSTATSTPSTPTVIPAGRHWAVNDSMESGTDVGNARSGWTGLVAGLWAAALVLLSLWPLLCDTGCINSDGTIL